MSFSRVLSENPRTVMSSTERRRRVLMASMVHGTVRLLKRAPRFEASRSPLDSCVSFDVVDISANHTSPAIAGSVSIQIQSPHIRNYDTARNLQGASFNIGG